MSHKATNWLSDLDPSLLGASEFRVLFHLCDCHNASAGCFPSQAYLRERAGVSNGTVNNVLNSLERKGLIKRHQTRDGRTKRQNPTRYILGFEIDGPQDPTPESGDGNPPKSGGGGSKKSTKPSPKSGVGAVSNLEADPTPISGPTRLQPTGEEPVSNQEITKAREKPAGFSDNPMTVSQAERAVRDFREGRANAIRELHDPAGLVSRHIVAAGMLTDAECRQAGIC
ncbi:helix-turn-helix domain-containing protein [Pacificoceanicola onchidii]|uniref:helix-turn-helix domain-containing protein n=1 Tax=Pacificoceanicola onchidii TaxID=2562685 RepID=UPI0010A44C74|nr:helix-turn-helix domain-containing protein [Pacificoceanicola onchidii]